MIGYVTGLPKKYEELFDVASTDVEVAKSTLQRLEDSLNKALHIQEQIKSCKSLQNYIPKDEIERSIMESNEKIEEATKILKRIEDLKNMPGYLTDKETEDLSASLDLFKHELSL